MHESLKLRIYTVTKDEDLDKARDNMDRDKFFPGCLEKLIMSGQQHITGCFMDL